MNEDTERIQTSSYAGWAKLLFDYFFHEGMKDQEILFAVDSQTFREMLPSDAENAESDFLEAVRGKILGSKWRVDIIQTDVEIWEGKDLEDPNRTEAHPALPFLALSVLAASKMGDAGENPTNYYKQLRKLIDPDDEGSGDPGADATGFKRHTHGLWLSVDDWSERILKGEKGILNVFDGPQNRKYVFMAQQHSFLRESDFRHLDDYCRLLNLEPGEDHGMRPSALRSSVRAWASGHVAETWGKRLYEACADREGAEKKLEEHCEKILNTRVSSWTGKAINPRTNRAYGTIRMTISPENLPLTPRLNFEYEEGFAYEGEEIRADGGGLSLSYEDGYPYYSPTRIAVEDMSSTTNLELVLRQGLEVITDIENFFFRARQSYIFVYKNDEMTSADRIPFGEQFWILTPSNRADALREFIFALKDDNNENSGEMEIVPPEHIPEVAESWTLIKNCQIDKPAIGEIPPELGGYMPSNSGERLSLLDGLSIGSSHKTYIVGGEPRCNPNAQADEGVKVNLRFEDGTIINEISPPENNDSIELWKYELEPGSYIVDHDDHEAKFTIHDKLLEKVEAEGAGSIGCDGFDVSGTRVFGDVSKSYNLPITCKIEEENFDFGPVILLGAYSNQYIEIFYPSWISEKGFIFDPYLECPAIDVWIDFQPVWMIANRNKIVEDSYEVVKIATPINNLECKASDSDLLVNSAWAKALRGVDIDGDANLDAKELLETYKTVCGAGDSSSRISKEVFPLPTEQDEKKKKCAKEKLIEEYLEAEEILRKIESSPGDELLYWASERGEGSWDTLKAGITHLANKHDFTIAPWNLARRLSDLGHLDINWEDNKWSIAKASLNLVPGMGMCAFLTGSRPYLFSKAIREPDDGVQTGVKDFLSGRGFSEGTYALSYLQNKNTQWQQLAPETIFIKGESVEALHDFAENIKVELVSNPSMQLMEVFKFENDYIQDEHRPFDSRTFSEEYKYYDPLKLKWENTSPDKPAGFYKYTSYKVRHFWFDGEDWKRVEPSVGYVKSLLSAKRKAFKWSSESKKKGKVNQASNFEVPVSVMLPSMVERSLVACSGLLPSEYESTLFIEAKERKVKRYLNVPKELSLTIGDRLNIGEIVEYVDR